MKKRFISLSLTILMLCGLLFNVSVTGQQSVAPLSETAEVSQLAEQEDGEQESSSASSEMASEDVEAVSNLTTTYSELQQEIERLQSEKDAVTAEKKNTSSYLSTLKKQISATQKQLDILNDEIEELDGELENLNSRITGVEENIAAQTEVFKARIRAMYVSGRSSELELLLNSGSFVDLLTRAEILRRISEYDNAVIGGLKKDKAELDTLAQEVSATKDERETAKSNADKKNDELSTQYDESQDVYEALKKDEAEYAAYIKQYQQEMEEAQREIDEILAKYVSKEQYAGGELLWPLPGFNTITSKYGQRSSGFHTGTDIAGRNSEGDLCYNYPVLAANSGTVILVGDRGTKSYGKYIIIDHGEDCRTLYAHLNKILVKEGDTVVRGDTIGKAGTTGNSTGYHLHFELWWYGERVDPLKHLTIPKY